MITLGKRQDNTLLTADLERIHNLLICGGNEGMRNNLLDIIRRQIKADECIEMDTNDAVANMKEKIEDGTLPAGCTFIINDYANYALAEGRENRMAASEYKKDIDYIASHSKAAGIRLILVCSRPCTDLLTIRLKHLFPLRVALKTISRVDSIVILDCPMAAGISDNEIVYRDEISCEVVRIDT